MLPYGANLMAAVVYKAAARLRRRCALPGLLKLVVCWRGAPTGPQKWVVLGPTGEFQSPTKRLDMLVACLVAMTPPTARRVPGTGSPSAVPERAAAAATATRAPAAAAPRQVRSVALLSSTHGDEIQRQPRAP